MAKGRHRRGIPEGHQGMIKGLKMKIRQPRQPANAHIYVYIYIHIRIYIYTQRLYLYMHIYIICIPIYICICIYVIYVLGMCTFYFAKKNIDFSWQLSAEIFRLKALGIGSGNGLEVGTNPVKSFTYMFL